MDYKHIEQLLERYWLCETTLMEEENLRSFFTIGDVPEHLLQYKHLFVYQVEQQKVKISCDFDERILSQIEEKRRVEAKRITFAMRMMPMLKAVAVVAIILTMGAALQQSLFKGNDTLDYNYDAYTDTYDDPEVAYKQVSSALLMLSEGINKSKDQHSSDSLKCTAEPEMMYEQ